MTSKTTQNRTNMGVNYYLTLNVDLASDVSPTWLTSVHVGKSITHVNPTGQQVQCWMWQVIRRAESNDGDRVAWPSETLHGRTLPVLDNTDRWCEFLEHLDDYGLVVKDEEGCVVENLVDIVKQCEPFPDLDHLTKYNTVIDKAGNACVDWVFY